MLISSFYCISQAEIMTLVIAACAIAIYGISSSKLQGVNTVTIITIERLFEHEEAMMHSALEPKNQDYELMDTLFFPTRQ